MALMRRRQSAFRPIHLSVMDATVERKYDINEAETVSLTTYTLICNGRYGGRKI